MSAPKTARMSVTAQEIAVTRRALEALKLTQPEPPPKAITLGSAVGELAVEIRELFKAGYSYEQIAECIKLGGILMDAARLKRHLTASDKKPTKTVRDKKAVPIVKQTSKKTEQAQQTVVQGATPTLTVPQTQPTPGSSVAPAASAIASPVVPPTSRPAVAGAATPKTPAAQSQHVPSTNPHSSSAPAPVTNQTVAPPSISRPQNAASPVASGASAPSTAQQTSDGSGRTASGGRTSDLPMSEQNRDRMESLRQFAFVVGEKGLPSALAAQGKSQTEGSAPTNPGTLF